MERPSLLPRFMTRRFLISLSAGVAASALTSLLLQRLCGTAPL